MYDELYSCPLVVILGSFTHRGHTGWVTLPLLNYRVALLRKNGEWRVVSNIDWERGYVRSMEACRSIAGEAVEGFNVELDLAVHTSFYGGIGSYILGETGLRPLSIDIVNTRVFKFYFKPREGDPRKPPEGNIGDWLLLQAALREGWVKPVAETCRALGSIRDGVCVVEADIGDIAIATSMIQLDGWLRVTPDNSPLRHVVAVERIS